MDRNEAIEHLRVVLKTCDVQDEEAVEMAIKALEQAKTNCSEIPNNSDTISRQAAIDELNDEYHGTISDESMKIYQIIKWLNELPSVQPEIIRCKDCKYYKYGICMKIGANKSFHGFCDWAERGEQNE